MTPATQQPHNQWLSKFVCVTTSVTSTTTRNFFQIGLGVLVLRMRDFGYFFWGGEVHEKGYRRDATTEFDAKYDAVPRKEVSFGVAKTISKV